MAVGVDGENSRGISSPSEHLLGPLFESMYKSKVSSEGI